VTIPLRLAIVELVAELRTAGVRVSVGESIDAMNAVGAAGLARARMREALRAALIKDEADGEAFEAAFARRFGAARLTGAPRRSEGARMGVSGSGRGSGSGAPPVSAPEDATPATGTGKTGPAQEIREARPAAAPRDETRGGTESEAGDGAEGATGSAPEGAEPVAHSGGGAETKGASEKAGGEFGGEALTRAIMELPFPKYSDLEYEIARDTLALLKRRLRVRLSRRLRIARSGRIDFRRTIRAGIQRGGRLADLRFRARRPRHVDLLLLTDISGSVRYASTLMLDLAAGVSECFRRVSSFVYVDRVAEASFEQGHLVMTPAIDLYARSDFGHVLGEIWERRAALLSRATLVVILGDGRNNRRPPRVDLLREIGRRCRGIWWLNPEPPERWNTGDSVIGQYGREVDELVPCGNLRELERALARVA